MKLRLSVKLFLSILAACAVVLVINGVFGRILFMRDFIGYLNDQGVERMQEVLPRVVAEYEKENSWDFARRDPRSWYHLMRPRITSNDPLLLGVPSVSEQTGAVPRFALIDMTGELIVGNTNAAQDAIRLPIESHGRQVGWFAMVPFQKAIAAGDVHFYNSQVRAWWINGAASVLVAALLAWLLSGALLKRLRHLAQFVHQLALGNYSLRIAHKSHDELGQLAGDISQLAGKLENIENNRRAFMADISHELRTPLAVLTAELEAIQDGIRPMNLDTLAPLRSEVQQLNKLVDDLYDLAVTQTGQFSYEFTAIDLGRIVQSAGANAQARAADSGLLLHSFAPENPVFIHGDEGRLQQLLSNLLENSIRYTDSGGEIRLRLLPIHGEALVTIDDSPPGVDSVSRAHLFDRFFRVEASRNRASGGSGLGLSICRNIVEAHGGSIHAEASQLGGLQIQIRFPLERQEHRA